MRNKPKTMPKVALKQQKMPKKPVVGEKNSPKVSYVYRKDAFNKVKIA